MITFTPSSKLLIMKLTSLVKGIFGAFSLIALYLLTTAQYDNPSNGKTGGPGEGMCTECHTSSNSNIAGNLEITGLPAQVFKGTRYNIDITVKSTQGTPKNAGIQMVVLDGDNRNTGELRNPRGISGIIQAGNRTYFEHKGGPTKFVDNEATWSVDWIAPDNITNPQITWYAATILGDGDSTQLGDVQILNNVSATVVEGVAPLIVEANESDISCGGTGDGSIELNVSGGILPYSYSWSNGDSSSSLNNLIPGTYTVTVTDADTSSATAMATISEPSTLNLNVIDVTSLGCSGQSNATAKLEVTGGNPPYLVVWPDGDTTLTKNNLSVGDFTVFVFDNSGCSDTTVVTVEAMINIQPNLQKMDESEPGAEDGLAYISPTGGTPPYLVSWSNGSTLDTISNLVPGTYFVIIADVSGCIVSDTLIIEAGVCDLSIATEQTDLICAGTNIGRVAVTMPSDDLIRSYEWSSGDTTRMVEDISGGIYYLKVTDTFGCVGFDTINVLEPDDLSVQLVAISSASCSQAGSARISVSGGTLPYSYAWTPDVIGSDSITGLQAGDYQVTVSDANDCSELFSLTVSNVDNTAPILVASEYTLFLDESGNANLNEINPSEILFDDCGIDSVWFSIANFSCSSQPTAVALQAWDEERNMLNSAFLVNVLDTSAPVSDNLDTLFIAGCDTAFYSVPVFTDNCGIDTVVVQSGLISGSIFPGGINEVVFQAIDISGNSSTATMIIKVDVDLEFSVSKNNVVCASDSTGQIIITSDPASQYSFQWSTGLLNDTLTNVPAGLYSVTITDTTGCNLIQDIAIDADFFEIQIDTVISKNNSGEGSIQVTILGGTEPFSYKWLVNNGATEINDVEDLSNLFDGTYELQVTDAKGCTITTGQIELNQSVANRKLETIGIQLFPNPVNDVLFIKNLNQIKLSAINVIDLNGRRIQRINSPNDQIQLQELKTGIYFLEFIVQHRSYYTQILKN